jgi:hypothetical protein
MDMNSRKIDPAKLEQGAWVGDIPEWGDLRLKVRGIGNSDFRRLQNKLFESVPRQKRVRGAIDPAEQDRITSTCLLNTVLIDWDNLQEDGVPVPFSQEAAKRFLFEPEFAEFRAAVSWAAAVVSEQGVASAQDALGNSPNASAGQ